jgi:uncharacterized protein (TIGR03435 family)
MKRPLVVILTAFASCAMSGQPAGGPEFEVASIRPVPAPTGGVARGPSGGPGTRDPGLYTCTFCGLTSLILQAYDIEVFQLSAPNWIQNDLFDINAKVPESATKEQFGLMLRRLLEERFKVAVRRETREISVYELVVAKNGSKLKPTTEDAKPGDSVAWSPGLDKDGYPTVPPGRTSMIANVRGTMRMRAKKETMEQLIAMLSAQVRGPVTDSTGLKGEYDFTLSWTRDLDAASVAPAASSESPLSGISGNDSEPPLFGALESQLGLRLDRKKGPVEMLVIDHIEKVPTHN